MIFLWKDSSHTRIKGLGNVVFSIIFHLNGIHMQMYHPFMTKNLLRRHMLHLGRTLNKNKYLYIHSVTLLALFCFCSSWVSCVMNGCVRLYFSVLVLILLVEKEYAHSFLKMGSIFLLGFNDMDSIYASPDDFKSMKNSEKMRGLHLLEYFVNRCHEIGVLKLCISSISLNNHGWIQAAKYGHLFSGLHLLQMACLLLQCDSHRLLVKHGFGGVMHKKLSAMKSRGSNLIFLLLVAGDLDHSKGGRPFLIDCFFFDSMAFKCSSCYFIHDIIRCSIVVIVAFPFYFSKQSLGVYMQGWSAAAVV